MAARNPIVELVEAEEGRRVVLQGNVAFAVGCARGGIHAADGYPGTPSTEVIDRALRHVQDRMCVGWSVNEANAVALGFGHTMVGADALVTMKIPGLFQAADVVATAAGFTVGRGGLVLYIASDFVPSSTQYVTDPRYFLKSCFVPVLEPRDHQEMLEVGPVAAALSRAHGTPVAVLVSGLLCHSEGLLRLNAVREVPLVEVEDGFRRFMNLPGIARRNYDAIHSERMPGLRRFAEQSERNRVAWHDRALGVVVHGITELYLREVWDDLPVKPSVLSLGMTFPLPRETVRRFVEGVDGPVVVLGDGLRFVQEEIRSLGLVVEGKEEGDSRTEWSPRAVARRLGAEAAEAPEDGGEPAPVDLAPVTRPANICAGCSYRAFGLVVRKLKKKKKIVASFGDIGCNTLLYFLDAIDTCTCMGASDAERQGVVLSDPSLAGRTISVIGDSTECHSGLDATRNAVFRNVPGVKVVLDNYTTAMTGGQPAPTSPVNLAGERSRFDLRVALEGEGARVEEVDAFDMEAIERALRAALERATAGEFSVLIVRGACIQEVPAQDRRPRFRILGEACKRCGLCAICPGIEEDQEGLPHFTPQCTGCGGKQAVCVQRCKLGAIVVGTRERRAAPPPLPPLVAAAAEPVAGLPPAIRLAVRGVGGQGNLFLGKVLAELALLLGYDNVVKGETHGMAQLGGAVISTFACGAVHSPVLAEGSVDVLVALEQSEVLRPGFLELLKPGGTVVLNRQRIIPAGLGAGAYPSIRRIRTALEGRELVELDALAEARALGDPRGRTGNVVTLGLLSTISPFSLIPASRWHEALLRVSPTEHTKRANLAAFERGRAARDARRGKGSRLPGGGRP